MDLSREQTSALIGLLWVVVVALLIMVGSGC